VMVLRRAPAQVSSLVTGGAAPLFWASAFNMRRPG